MSQVEEVSEDHELLGHDAAVLEMPESTRMVLEWKDLHYSVKNKEILKGVSGAAYPGELLALMGPSGSGKSTLLGLLSGKIPSTSKMTGHLAANGERFGKRYSKESVGFVHQEDMLLPNHSVLETFQFSADLRLPKSMSPKERLERIEQVISILRLAHVKNSQIGGPFKRGVSGGERKRVSVGLELIRNVSVLLLDEPTSGLDSFMALGVMQCLKDLAKKSNMTVICAIHQPRSQIWKLFDKILLLSEGQTVYYGPCGDQVVEHFAALGHCCPDHYNPPDFLLDLIAVDYRTEETEKSTRARVEELLAAPHLSVLPESLEAEVQQADHFTQKIKTASALKQSAVVAKRSLLEKARDFTFLLRFVEATILSVLLGIIYFQLPLDQAGTQSRSGLLFFSVVYAAFGTLQATIPLILREKPIFRKENAANYYGVTAYFLGKNFAELPLDIVVPILFSVIVYWMTGLQQQADKFFIFTAAIILCGLCSQGLGLAIASVAPTQIFADILSPLIMLFAIMTGGFYANSDSIPGFIRWITDINYVYRVFSILSVNEFTGLTFSCGGSENCRFQNGEEVLASFGLQNSSITTDFVILLAISLVFRVIAYLGMRITKSSDKLVQ